MERRRKKRRSEGGAAGLLLLGCLAFMSCHSNENISLCFVVFCLISSSPSCSVLPRPALPGREGGSADSMYCLVGERMNEPKRQIHLFLPHVVQVYNNNSNNNITLLLLHPEPIFIPISIDSRKSIWSTCQSINQSINTSGVSRPIGGGGGSV